MNSPRVRVIDRLRLYGVYQIRYGHGAARTGGKSVRALFLGETKKAAVHSLDELLDQGADDATSFTARYLDVMVMVYRPGNRIPESPPTTRYDVFTLIYCSPDDLTQTPDDVLVIPIRHRLRQLVDDPADPHRELFQKLRIIGENSGLIDTNLARIGMKAPGPLTKTKIRVLHRGFTKMVERAHPDVELSE